MAVVQILRGSRGMFALDSDGKISFRRFKSHGGNGWRRFTGPTGVPKVTQIMRGSDGLFTLHTDGTIRFRKFGRRHANAWTVFDGPGPASGARPSPSSTRREDW